MTNRCVRSLLLSALPCLVCLAAPGTALDTLWCRVYEAGTDPAKAPLLELPQTQTEIPGGMRLSGSLGEVVRGQRADVRVTDTTGKEREIVVELGLTVTTPFTQVFLTDGAGPRALPDTGTGVYRSPLALPAATFYGPESGLTVAAPFDVPAPTLAFAWTRKDGATTVRSVCASSSSSAEACAAPRPSPSSWQATSSSFVSSTSRAAAVCSRYPRRVLPAMAPLSCAERRTAGNSTGIPMRRRARPRLRPWLPRARPAGQPFLGRRGASRGGLAPTHAPTYRLAQLRWDAVATAPRREPLVLVLRPGVGLLLGHLARVRQDGPVVEQSEISG